MKRVILALIVVFMLSFCGCSSSPLPVAPNVSNDIETAPLPATPDASVDIEILKDWSFQNNPGTNDYSLFFGLLNSKDEYIAADVNVDIRIVNDVGEEVYSATKSVTVDDFGDYESKIAGKQYLANVRIPASDIKDGKSNNGTVYMTVYKDDTVRFDEVNCSALYCLPVADVQVIAKELPVELNVKGYDGSIESTISITDLSYTFEKGLLPQLKITFSGVKTYGNSSSYDIICYKLYDSEGYLIDSGDVFLMSLDVGDKFKDDSIMVYDITPGEEYTLQFVEYDWDIY